MFLLNMPQIGFTRWHRRKSRCRRTLRCFRRARSRPTSVVEERNRAGSGNGHRREHRHCTSIQFQVRRRSSSFRLAAAPSTLAGAPVGCGEPSFFSGLRSHEPRSYASRTNRCCRLCMSWQLRVPVYVRLDYLVIKPLGTRGVVIFRGDAELFYLSIIPTHSQFDTVERQS